jgi:hypothetical protein
MKPAMARNRPNIWALAGVTYGLVIATTLIAVGGYVYLRARMPNARQAEIEFPSTIAVGSAYVPLYPGSSIDSTDSAAREDSVETTSHFHAAAPANTIMTFYQMRLARGIYRLDRAKRGDGGGTVQASAHEGKTTVTVKVEPATNGSTGVITTLDRKDK